MGSRSQAGSRSLGQKPSDAVTDLLLDTSPVIDLQRRDSATQAFLDNARSVGIRLWGTPVLLAEYYSGVLLGEGPRIDQFLASLHYFPITNAIGLHAAAYRYEFRRRGIQLQTADTLVAACARSIGADLLTGNLKDFPMTDIRVVAIPKF